MGPAYPPLPISAVLLGFFLPPHAPPMTHPPPVARVGSCASSVKETSESRDDYIVSLLKECPSEAAVLPTLDKRTSGARTVSLGASGRGEEREDEDVEGAREAGPVFRAMWKHEGASDGSGRVWDVGQEELEKTGGDEEEVEEDAAGPM